MRGFTLVELILVMVIIGILAAVVGPRFFNRQVFDERLFYEESLAAVRYGQKLAVASGCRIQVSINNAGYRVMRDANCVAGGVPNFSADVLGPDGQTPYLGNRPGNVIIPANTFPVTFDSLGRPAAAANAVIGAFAISVAANTGLVQ